MGGKVDRPYSPQTHIPEPEIDQPVGVKARVLSTLLDPQLYNSPVLGLFLLVCLADVVATLSLFIPFHYVPSIARERGLTQTQGAMLISATGVCSTAGRVVAGWVCDRSWLHPISIASLSTFIICTSLYGWLTGCWIAVMSPIFVRLLGLQLLSPAFSFLTAVRGLATLSGPPLAGALVDKFQDKLAAIYLASVIMHHGIKHHQCEKRQPSG